MSDYSMFFDGSCGPKNPGPTGGYGYIIHKDGRFYAKESGPLVAEMLSNNYAEFYAVYKGLEFLDLVLEKGDRLFVRGDSQLVINIMNGKFKGRSSSLYYPAYEKAHNVRKSITKKYIPVSFDWVPREYNKEADTLSTEYRIS